MEGFYAIECVGLFMDDCYFTFIFFCIIYSFSQADLREFYTSFYFVHLIF